MKINETKRFISFLLVVVMLFGMMPTTSYAIPYADYYLKVGDTMTLQGSYGYIHQWSSSDDSIVAVSNDYRASNTITAKKLGGPVVITHGRGDWVNQWKIMVVEEYPSQSEIRQYPIYFFLAKPGETPTTNSTYAPLPGHEQGTVYGTKAATTELVQPNIEFRNVNDENIVKQYIDLTPEQLNAIENFGTQTFYFGDGTNATYNSDQYDLIWYTICVRDGCCGAGTHLHVDAVLSERVNPAELELEKIIPDPLDEDVSFTFQLEKLQEDNNNKPINAVDTYFEPMQLSTTIPKGSTKAAITWIGDRQLTFGYYRLTENLSPEDSVMWDADVWYIWIHTDGTLLFSKKYNTDYKTVDVVPVNNSYLEYSVRYTDGVAGEDIFADQVYTGLKYTDGHPAFLVDGKPGEPVRSGYTFEGWKTSAEGETAIYTATWEIIPGDLKVEKQFVGVKELPKNFRIDVAGAGSFKETLTLDDPNVEEVIDGTTHTFTWTFEDVHPGVYQATEYDYGITGHLRVAGASNDIDTVESNGITTLYLRNVYNLNKYTVTWNDGTNDLYSEELEYLTVPKYNGSALTAVGAVHTGWRESTTGNLYGLTDALSAVKGKVTYTAEYTPIYTVRYTDGVEGVEVFEDQVHENVLQGTKTPLFDGEGDSTIPVRPGYVFKRWAPEVSDDVTASVVYTAVWEESDDTQYTVKHYLMNGDGSYPDPDAPSAVEYLTGKTNALVVAVEKDYSGYKAIAHANSVTSGTIAADGSLVLKVYYTKTFTLTYVDYDGSKLYDEYVPYGTSVEAMTSRRIGKNHSDPDYTYKFTHWDQIDPVDDTDTVKSDMTFEAQYEATPILRTGTVTVYMNGVETPMQEGAKLYVTKESAPTKGSIVTELKAKTTGSGVYQAELTSGQYYIYLGTGTGSYIAVPNRILEIGQHKDGSARIDYYTVSYETEGSAENIPATEYYLAGREVLVSRKVPVRDGHLFTGWKLGEKVYKPSTENYNTVLTSSIGTGYVLEAQWEEVKTVNVVVTVKHTTVDHAKNPNIGGTMYVRLTDSRGDVFGQNREIAVQPTNQTTVIYDGIQFTNLSTLETYSARAELAGYSVVGVTTEAAVVDGKTIETVRIELQYDPAGFELTFDVVFRHYEDLGMSKVDKRLIPEAIDVQISYYDNGNWIPLSHNGKEAGSVEVTDLIQNDDTWKGTGTYHVWGIRNQSTNTPYYYRAEVVGVDLVDGYYLTMDENGKSEDSDFFFFPGGAFSAEGDHSDEVGTAPGIYGTVSGSSIEQVGTLTLTVTGTPYKVQFDPDGGIWKVGEASEKKLVSDRFTVPDLTQYNPVKDGAIFRGWFVDGGEKDGQQVHTANHIKDLGVSLGAILNLKAKWAYDLTVKGTIDIDNYYMLNGNVHYINDDGLPKEIVVHVHNANNHNLVGSTTVPIQIWNTSGASIQYEVKNLPNDGTKYYVEAEIPTYVTTYQNVSGAAYSTTSNQAIFANEEIISNVNAKLAFAPEDFYLDYIVDGKNLGDGFQLTAGAIVTYGLKASGSIDAWDVITQQKVNDNIVSNQLAVSKNNNGTGQYSVWNIHVSGETYLYAIRIHDYSAVVNGETVTAVTYDAIKAPFTVEYTPSYDYYGASVSTLTAILTPKDYAIRYDLNGGKISGQPTKHVWSYATSIPQPTKEGHTFTGWTVTPDVPGLEGGKSVQIPAHVATDVTLTANWAVDNNNDGTPDDQQIFVTYAAVKGGIVSTTSAIVNVSSGAAVATAEAVTATTEPGYTFVGWTLTSGDEGTVTFDKTKPVIQPVFNSGAFGKTYEFTANFAVDKNNDGTPDEQQATIVFITDGNGSLTGKTTQVFDLEKNGENWIKTVTPEKVTPVAASGFAFDYWTTDGTDRVKPFASHTLTSGQTVTYQAIFAEDKDEDTIPDKYQKKVIFRVTNGAWGTSESALDKEDRIYTVDLWKNGQYTEDGRADIRGLIPDLSGIVADPGFITSEPAYWTPALPSDSVVTGTEPAIYVLNFMTTVTYDAQGADKDVTLPIRNEGKILVNPNGGTWKGSGDKQAVTVEVVSGVAYTLAPEPTRADHVFDGWTMSEPQNGDYAYEFTAQWIHKANLYYPVNVSILLDDVLTTAGGVHPGSTGFVLKLADGTGVEHSLTLSSSGIYEGSVRPGTYNLYRVHGEHREKVGDYNLVVTFDGGKLIVAHYSVTYDLNQGTGTDIPAQEIYFYGTDVKVTDKTPTRDGYRFLGWKYNDDNSRLWNPGDTFTGPIGIATKAAFVAQWEDLIDVTVNVEIYYGQDNDGNHKQVTWQLMDQVSDARAFQPVGDKMILNPASAAAMNYSYEYITSTGAVTNEASAEGIRFTAITPTYIGLPQGDYTINSAKFNYDLTTTTTAGTSAGDLVFNMKLVFNPNDFNLKFGVDMDNSVPKELIPKNVNVKVLCWNTSSWAIIAQQKEASNPPVSVAVNTESGQGTGFYPVWMHDGNNNPYYYRVLVTGFVYPDGSVKSAVYNAATGTYSDGNYTATVNVTGVATPGYDGLTGAYYTTTGGVGAQKGTITVHVTAEKYDVTFDANGGKIHSADKYTVINQYVVPSLSAFTPTRDNYIFKGWYTNKEFTTTMTTGQALTTDTAFYAKWEPIQAIYGTIYVDGLYDHGGTQTEVRNTCLPTEVTVYLQRYDGINAYDIANQKVTVDWGNAIQKHGLAAYEFTSLSALAAGNYQIVVRETNYTSSYNNAKSTSSGAFDSEHYKAEFKNAMATQTYVNALLSFAPERFDQKVVVDASQIGASYRPDVLRVELLYKEQGTSNSFERINEHTVAPYGLEINLNKAATAEAIQTGLWRKSWNKNHLYDYMAKLIKVDIQDFNAEEAPFIVSYSDVAHWNGTGSSGPLTVTLTPKTYDIVYDYGYDDIEVVSAGAHKWSFETALSAERPTREGFVFMGWYDNKELQGQPVTKVDASVHETTRVYAKWEDDSLKFDPTIGNLGGGDGIPDIYQCVVEFHIVGGTWGERGGSAPIGVIYNLKEFNGTSGQWIDANPVLGNRIPTNMICVDPTTTQGAWSEPITSETAVKGSATYTYTYTHSVTVTVENGSVTVGNDKTYKNTTFTLPAQHNEGEAAEFEFKFAPQLNYVLKSVTVDGVPTGSGFNTSGVGIIHVDHEKSHKIHVVYDVDANKDNVADSFQKKILFQAVNGHWNAAGNPTLISRYVTLLKNGVPAEDGSATIEGMIPTATPAAGYKGGVWDVDPATNYVVTGTKDVTYTFTYQQIQYYDYHYAIHHVLQQTSGNYAEDAGVVDERVAKIEMNLTGTAFEAGKIPTLKVEPSDYKDYGVHYHVNTGAGILSITPVYGSGAGQQSAHRLEVRYDLDSHTLTYDPDNGESVSTMSALCGSDVTVTAAPIKDEHVFMGWKMTSGAAVGTIYQPGAKLTFNEDTELQAQWKLDVNGDEIPDETQVFVIYQAATGGAVSSTGEAVKFSGDTAVAAGSKAITSSGIAFDGWVLTSGAAADVTFDPDKAELKPVFKEEAAGQTYVFKAVFAEDKDKDDIADKYQKKIIFTVTNGAWSVTSGVVDKADKTETVTLMKDGKPALDGQANITSLIPTTAGVSANAGYITTTSPFWSDNLPKNGIVTGTATETYTLNFYTTVTYDDYLKTEDGIVVIRPGEKILVKPNGSSEEIATWNGISTDQSVIVNVIDGKAYVLTPEAIRDHNVFNGWKCEKGTDGIHAYVFTAQWIHKMTLTYPVTVIGKLDDEIVTVGAVHAGATGLRLISRDAAKTTYTLTENTSGAYIGKVLPGLYDIYRVESNAGQEHEHKVGDFFLNVTYEGGSAEINHYSVNYDLDGGNASGLALKEIYFRGTKNLKITDIVPTKAGFEFLGWKNTAETGDRTYAGGDAITGSNGITTKAAFVAQWRELINITVHVEIDHSAGTGGQDDSGNRDEVTFELMKDGLTVVPESQRSLSETDATGYAVTTSDAFTTYTAVGKTYTNLVAGDYVISCTKLGYEVTSSMSSISTTEKAFFVKMKFVPDEFELGFDVEMADGTPKELWPESVNVRILYWDGDSWEIITQQDEEATEAPKNVTIDVTSGTGMGTYPVWKNESGSSNPYYYRVMVSSFVEPGHSPSKATTSQTGIYTDGNYTAVVTVTGGTIVTTGGLEGAYIASGSSIQTGRPLVTISVEKYDVVFDAMGGAVSEAAILTKAGLYQVPDLTQITPVRDNYIFRGWYVNQACTEAAVSNAFLVRDLTLYAKWEPIQEIFGTIIVDGRGVREACKPSNVVVELVRFDGLEKLIDTTVAAVTWSGTTGNAIYEFTSLQALTSDDHYYMIRINEINYTTYYSNETHSGSYSTDAAFQKADFSETTPTATYVKAQLVFKPDTFVQEVKVDATSIGEGYRPNNVKTRFMYVRQGTTDVQPAYVHSATDGGIIVGLAADGTGSATEGGLRKRAWNEDRTQVVLYDYHAKVTKVSGAAFEETNPYYTVSYGNSIHWIQAENRSSGILEVKLTPKTYNINYVLDGGTLASGSPEKHIWSYTTNVAAATRDGCIFLGWTADDASITSGTSITIPAVLAKDVTLTAHWTLDENRDGTPDNQQVFIKYVAGAGGTVNVTEEAITLGGVSAAGATATAISGYAFDGWTLTSTGDVNAATYTATNPALTPTFTNEAAGKTYTFTANFAVSANGDDVPDYKQGFIVFTADANGKVEGTTNQAFTLTKGALGYTGKVTPEVVTAKAITSGFAFDYWSIDGTTKVDPFKEQTLTGNQTVTYTAYFAKDVNNDGKPDKYQKPITFKIINGTWEGHVTTEVSFYVDLDKYGKADIADDIPTPVAIENFTNSRWDNSPYGDSKGMSAIVSGTGPAVYTYRYTAYTYEYEIEHYKQKVNGEYGLDTTTAGIGVATINDDNTAFVGGHILSVGSYDLKNYGDHYSAVKTTTAAPLYDPGVGVADKPVVEAYYDLDSHKLTYVHGNGTADEVITTRHGITLTAKDAPEREHFFFDGWEASTSGGVISTYAIGTSITLEEDMTLTARWRADVNNDDVPDDMQKLVTFEIINGTWDQTGGLTTTTACIDLDAVDGKADISSLIPTAVPNANCTGGAWITGPAVNKMVYGSDPVTYTYRFGSYIYDYTIRHEKQKVDGTYEVAETVTKSAVIELAESNVAFAGVQILSVDSFRDYGEHYFVNESKSVKAGTAVYGQSLTLVVKYDLDTHTLTYVNGNGTSDEAITVTCGAVVRVKAAPTRSGYTFQHWIATTAAGVETTTYAALSDIAIAENTTLTALWKQNPAPPSGGGGGGGTEEEPEGNLPGKAEIPEEFTRDHKSFVSGYPDGTIRPEGKITRAEVAAIFYNLLTDEIRAQYTKDVYSRSFTDVKASDWFYTAVSAMSEMGVINGYPDGSFQPNGQITRAEFAAIASKFGDNVGAAGNAFSDINGHWGSSLIGAVAGNGWVSGYTDGTFKPNQKVTRAEAMAIINNVLHRLPKDANSLLPGMKIWPDNSNRSKWYYLTVQEASNGHDYERHADGTEYWTRLK